MEAAAVSENITMETTAMNIKDDYSEKSFAVYGETKQFKDTLKALGGRFNRYLKIDGDSKIGWIFPNSRKEVVVEFVMKANNGETDFEIPSTEAGDLPTIDKPVNNKKYQYVKYKVYRPNDNQIVQLKVEGTTKEGKVIRTETHNDIVDTVYIDFDGQTTLAKICNGKWEIFGYNVNHFIYFK